ncbi:MAG: hypothetical protein ABJZ55_14805 [Fuerstiella sp.]
MSESVKSWFISGGALIVGMATVVVIWLGISQEDQAIADNKVRFSELSGKEQADLRNKAKAFVNTTNKSELVRLQQIHDAVVSDEKLLTRLKSLDGLLANLDAETEASLNPDGEFADDWAQQVEILALDKNAGDVTYEFRIDLSRDLRVHRPAIMVNGHEYEAFLDAASGEDWGDHQEYQKFLNGNDRTTRRMFKTIALIERSMEEESNDFNASVIKLAREILVPKGSVQDDRKRPSEYGSEKKVSEEREKANAELRVLFTNGKALEVLESGLNNVRDEFLRREASETVAPEVFTKQFKRSEQIELMAMAPDAANQELIARLVRDNHVQGSETARINEILAGVKKQIPQRFHEIRVNVRECMGGSWRGGRGGDGRGGDGRGGDGRGGDGRGGEGRGGEGRGSRGPDDRGPQGRGPGGRGQGGPNGARFEDDRGPDGKPGRGPEGRDQDGRGRQGQRPPLDSDETESGKK